MWTIYSTTTASDPRSRATGEVLADEMLALPAVWSCSLIGTGLTFVRLGLIEEYPDVRSSASEIERRAYLPILSISDRGALLSELDHMIRQVTGDDKVQFILAGTIACRLQIEDIPAQRRVVTEIKVGVEFPESSGVLDEFEEISSTLIACTATQPKTGSRRSHQQSES